MAQHKYPCYKCEDRVSGCQSKCEKYLEAKAKHEAEKKMIRAFRAAENDYHGFIAESIVANKKGRK